MSTKERMEFPKNERHSALLLHKLKFLGAIEWFDKISCVSFKVFFWVSVFIFLRTVYDICLPLLFWQTNHSNKRNHQDWDQGQHSPSSYVIICSYKYPIIYFLKGTLTGKMLCLIHYSISTLYKATSHEKCISASVMTNDLSHTPSQ